MEIVSRPDTRAHTPGVAFHKRDLLVRFSPLLTMQPHSATDVR